MKLETFFEKFDQFADAPGAVAKMRELVLDWAANGRLLTLERKWETRSLKLLSTKIGSGATPAGGRESYFSEGIPLIRSMNVHFRGFDPTGLVFLSDKQAGALSNVIVQANDILLNITGASIGRVTIAPAEMAGARVNQHVTIIRPISELFPRFLWVFLASPSVQRMINEIQVGATRQALTKGMIEQFEIPLPPLVEQKRIVAKVDEMMALCDRLEAQQQAREEQSSQLARASLARFATAPTPANLNYLFHPSYNISPADLRKSILTLAVQGKLVPQNANDEPGVAILRRIQLNVPSKNDQKGSDLGPATEGIPFKIPTGWSMARLGSILNPKRGISYGVIKLGAEPQQGGVFILRCSNVRFRKIDLAGIRKVTEEISSEYSRTILQGGEVLINVRGTLGGCAFVPPTLKGYNIAREVAVIPVHSEIEGTFLLNVIASPYFQDRIDESLRGIAYEGLNLGLLREFLIPIPPLAEQLRIVAKVEQLMTLADELETHLTTTRTTAQNLLSALVAELSTPI